jgi:predicted acylesterase/phospholipase RssA
MTDLAAADYAAPTRECDIVMKGGITSGVVYPHAVCELAQTYRFVQVGGTSAGAIAAAATAAAELGRGQGGFQELAALPAWLGGGRHLQELFQPQRATEGLFRMMLAALEHKRAKPLWVLLTGLRRFPLLPLLGALPGVALIVLAVLDGSGAAVPAAIVGGVLLAAIGAAAGLTVAVARRVTRAIPDNLYGLCSGNARRGDSRPALTPWLTGLIERCAGRVGDDGQLPATPLTFGHLDAEGGPKLAMMTTNLTNHTAHKLPWDSREYWFHPDEMRRLFPEHVVQHMLENPASLPQGAADQRDAELRREYLAPLCPLPAPEHLPVVVAARMSLSFPILLSAVPLYKIDFSLERNQKLSEVWRKWRSAGEQGERPSEHPTAGVCWFTDGGASSNFPVHFFDAPLPRRPTFAINLRPFHPDYKETKDERENVWMVSDAVGGQLAWWYELPKAGGVLDRRLVAFLGNIVRTMQNRVDDAQLRMPGVRDRVVHVSLSDTEGGMNLTMERETITALTERGREAGAKLVRRFDEDRAPGEPLSWRDHRWTRLRCAMPAVAELLGNVSEAFATQPSDGAPGYRDLLATGHGPPYKMTPAQRGTAGVAFERVVELRDDMEKAQEAFGAGRPQPPPGARMMPPD